MANALGLFEGLKLRFKPKLKPMVTPYDETVRKTLRVGIIV